MKITFGFNCKNNSHFGIMMYHNNRLIKSYEKVGCQMKVSDQCFPSALRNGGGERNMASSKIGPVHRSLLSGPMVLQDLTSLAQEFLNLVTGLSVSVSRLLNLYPYCTLV